jgi:hypothetical protein
VHGSSSVTALFRRGGLHMLHFEIQDAQTRPSASSKYELKSELQYTGAVGSTHYMVEVWIGHVADWSAVDHAVETLNASLRNSSRAASATGNCRKRDVSRFQNTADLSLFLPRLPYV